MIARKNWLQMQMQDADADGAESWAQAVSGIEIPSPAATAREVPPTRIPGGHSGPLGLEQALRG